MRRRGWGTSAVAFEGTPSLPLDSSPPVTRLMVRRENATPHSWARRVLGGWTLVNPAPSNPISTTHLHMAQKSTKQRHQHPAHAQRQHSEAKIGVQQLFLDSGAVHQGPETTHSLVNSQQPIMADEFDDSYQDDSFVSPSTPAPGRPKAPSNQNSRFDTDEAREAALRKELEGVRKINEVIEGVIGTLERAKGNMGVCCDRPTCFTCMH